MLKYFLLWFPMLLIAIGNGFLREAVIKKWVSELTAHQISTATLLLFFAVYIGFVIKNFAPHSSTQAIFIGVLWLILTLAFEFGFGRWRGNPWEKLLMDYNLLKGRLWVLIPLWVTIAPLLYYRLLR
jgi:hypothetical protein